MQRSAPICTICTHFDHEGLSTVPFSCTAFPKGIPDEIIQGSNKHTEKLDGQENDIVFELDTGISVVTGITEKDFE